MRLYNWIIGIILVMACSSSKSEMPTNSVSLGGASVTTTNTSGNSSFAGATQTNKNTGGFVSYGGSSTSISIGGSGISGDTSVIISEGGAGTSDPPPATGGEGTTVDPPKSGSGNNTDPPPGDTFDPPPGDTIDPPPGDTIDPPPGDTIDPPPGDTIDPPPGCTMTEIDKVNVIVFKDANPSDADSEGRMWVGGNLNINGQYPVNTTTLPEFASTCADWALVVGGNITGNPIVPAGKVAYGGTFNGTFNGTFSGNCGIFHNGSVVDFTALEAKLTGYSAAFKAYTTQNSDVVGTVTATGSQLVLTGTNKELNVFNITSTQLNSAEIKFVVPNTSSIIVNISGTVINWGAKGIVLPDGTGNCKSGTSSWCHKILYNMYEATSVYMSSIAVQGSVLAPYATVDGGGGNIDGQLICKYLKGGLEYHPYFFTGCLLLPDP
jgi:choice-of-anchor A domain-containing protein